MPIKPKVVKTVKKVIKDKHSVAMYDLSGKEAGSLSLPEKIFYAKVNKPLLVQALRVYRANQKTQPGSTKTRGEVHGTTAKMYRQKGTGRARHGAKTAPIFVGGGIAFGPKPRVTRLDLPKKMKHAALISALSQKCLDGKIIGLSGLEKASGKTKQMFELKTKLAAKSLLLVEDKKTDAALKAVRNIENFNCVSIDSLNAYEISRYALIGFSKAAVEAMQK